MSQKKQAASSARAGGITDGVIWEQLLVFFFPILFGAFFNSCIIQLTQCGGSFYRFA